MKDPLCPGGWGREKQETEASLLGGQELAGRREARDARTCRVYLDSPRIQAGSPSQTSARLIFMGCQVPDVCDKDVVLRHHCWSPGPSTGPARQ